MEGVGNGTKGLKIDSILRFSPLPGPVKDLLLGHMVSTQHSVLGDKVIFMHLYCTVLYCTVLCCTVLYCTVLCCTVGHLHAGRAAPRVR